MNLQSQKAIKTKSNSIKAYYCGVSALALLLLLILLVSIQHFFPFSLAFVFTLIELSFMALFILGNVYTAKSLREPYSVKKIIGIVLNGLYTLLFLGLILANILDIYRSM